MAWDETKEEGSNLTSEDWNEHVEDQKNRTTPEEAADAAPIQSVFGRVGDVVAESGDYAASQIDNFATAVIDAIQGSAIEPESVNAQSVSTDNASFGGKDLFYVGEDIEYDFTQETVDGEDVLTFDSFSGGFLPSGECYVLELSLLATGSGHNELRINGEGDGNGNYTYIDHTGEEFSNEDGVLLNEGGSSASGDSWIILISPQNRPSFGLLPAVTPTRSNSWGTGGGHEDSVSVDSIEIHLSTEDAQIGRAFMYKRSGV